MEPRLLSKCVEHRPHRAIVHAARQKCHFEHEGILDYPIEYLDGDIYPIVSGWSQHDTTPVHVLQVVQIKLTIQFPQAEYSPITV